MSSNDKDESNTACTSFTCFLKLPLEFRLRVWKATSFHPRNVDIWNDAIIIGLTTLIGGPVTREIDTSLPCYKSTSLHPAVLHCCHESRQEGLKHYKLDFGVVYRFENGGLTVTKDARIYVNWGADTICVMDTHNYNPARFRDLLSIVKGKDLHSMAFAVGIEWATQDLPLLLRQTQLPPSSWVFACRADIGDIILFPSIYLDSNGNRPPVTLTRKLLLGSKGMTMQWEDFTNTFDCIQNHVQHFRDMVLDEVAGDDYEQQPAHVYSGKGSQLILKPKPEIKVCDVSYDFLYEGKREESRRASA